METGSPPSPPARQPKVGRSGFCRWTFELTDSPQIPTSLGHAMSTVLTWWRDFGHQPSGAALHDRWKGKVPGSYVWRQKNDGTDDAASGAG